MDRLLLIGYDRVAKVWTNCFEAGNVLGAYRSIKQVMGSMPEFFDFDFFCIAKVETTELAVTVKPFPSPVLIVRNGELVEEVDRDW